MAEREDPKVLLARQRAATMSKSMSGESLQQQAKDTWNELKKTTWPDRPTLLKLTYIVLAFIGFTAIWVGFFDFILTHVSKVIFGL